MSSKKICLTGIRFGKLVVIGEAESKKLKRGTIIRWLCVCDCGGTKTTSTSNLIRGQATSCGCLSIQMLKDRVTKHGKSDNSNEYRIWAGMKYRCNNRHYNKSNKTYSERKITVCDRWLDKENGFLNFLEDMGARPSKDHTLDRHPNKYGNYEPSNCRWANWFEQQGNRTNNRWIECDGKNMILSDWARELGVHQSKIAWHLKRRSMAEVIEFFKNKKSKK